MDKETIDYIINVLRQGTITWSRRTECLNRGRRKRVIGVIKHGPNKGQEKFVWERNCDQCGEWKDLKDNLFEVDHIVEIGGFEASNCDWNVFLPRMYCELDNLQALCHSCHARKTATFNATMRKLTRKIRNAESYL